MTALLEIKRLINRYSFTIDTGDFDGTAALFEHGEWIMDGAESIVGSEAILDTLSNVKLYEDGTPKTKHLTTNIEIEVDEMEGNAASQCYVTVFQQTDDFPLQPIFSGHYFDSFECVDDVWRFTKRLIRFTLVGDMSAHLDVPSDVVPKA